ncbi:hypothetical protein [Gordonia phthalatica]|uniref:DUF732 domain-containing protein n=1 Tax=Gordonia phthalatica TaxID=1136941 RepID=A0A0N9N1K7_9ACTN|nr:hypothetical protein [Gordonia phthalatica]ALG84492.1 hypothetical protein ACH46_08260 [Gordonia phthalatica]
MGKYSTVFGRTRRVAAAGVLAASAAMIAPLAVSGPIASAAPSTSATPSESQLDGLPEPSFPMPVRDGALGYLATRSATLWLEDRGADDVIRNLPVPPAYVDANRGMATNLERELKSAKQTPGACLQIIVDGPDSSGGLFNYGFYAVEKQYCPK